MATTRTTNLRLQKPGSADRAWDVPLNANADALEAMAPLSHLFARASESPSTTRNVVVAPGKYVKRDYSVGSYAGGTITVTASSTRVLYLDAGASYALTQGSSYPAGQHIRIATVVAGASSITSVADDRVGGNLAVGT